MTVLESSPRALGAESPADPLCVEVGESSVSASPAGPEWGTSELPPGGAGCSPVECETPSRAVRDAQSELAEDDEMSRKAKVSGRPHWSTLN